MTPNKKAFDAGFDAGYALGQSHAGEGGYWLEPPTRDKAWEKFLKPKKKTKKVKKLSMDDEDIPY